MTMLANKTETRALTLADYEARIHLYKEQGAMAYIGIGRTLTEAKEAGVVPHGQWETWVQEVAGFTPRQAQRCMQVAEKVPEGSAMAKLDISKALLLIGSGLDAEEQEAIAAQAAEENPTVKELKEQLKQEKLKRVQETGAAVEIREALKKAEEDRERLEQQLRATESAYKIRINDEKEDAFRRGEMAGGADAAAEIRKLQRALDIANRKADDVHKAGLKIMKERDTLKQQIDEEREQAYRAGLQAGKPMDYAALKQNQDDLLAAAADAEKRAADAEAELEALKAGGAGQADPVWKVLKVAVTRFMTDCEMMPLDPAALIPEKARILANVQWLEKWTGMMRKALEGAVPGEGAVE